MNDLNDSIEAYSRSVVRLYQTVIDFYMCYEWQRHRYLVLNLHDIPADTLCPYEDPR